MKRACLAGSVLLFLSACQLPQEREPLRLMPEDTPPQPYAKLLERARSQAITATEEFQLNRWNDVQESARGLEQTARFLAKAQDVPPRQKDVLQKTSDNLAKEAVLLRDNAKAQDVNKVNETLQRINLTVRELRLDQ